MARLYLTEQHSILRKTGDRLIVEKEGEVLLEVPCLKLEAVLIYLRPVHHPGGGRAAGAWHRAGDLLLHRPVVGPTHAAQGAQCGLAAEATAGAAGGILPGARPSHRPGRIRNGVAVLKRFRANHPQELAEEVVGEVEKALGRIDSCTSLDMLRGVEGSAAAAYFKGFASWVPRQLGFAGRQRRPPRDPVNSLLSFGYVIVSNELQSLLDGLGFDPFIGFYHRLDYGRPSLALDLLEEFRPAWWTASPPTS